VSDLDEEHSRQLIGTLEEEIQSIESTLADKKKALSVLKGEHIRIYGPLYRCRICNAPHEDQEFAENYNNLLVCGHCESRALTASNDEPFHDSGEDDGDNPLFIDGIKVWRRYKFSGYITLFDEHDCENVMDFYHKHFNL